MVIQMARQSAAYEHKRSAMVSQIDTPHFSQVAQDADQNTANSNIIEPKPCHCTRTTLSATRWQRAQTRVLKETTVGGSPPHCRQIDSKEESIVGGCDSDIHSSEN